MDSSVNINSEIISFKKYLLSNNVVLKDILDKLETISSKSREAFKAALTKDNRIDNQLLELNQSKTHGFAWFDTYRIGLRETLNWFNRLNDDDKSSEIDAAVTLFAFAEYLTQMKNGIMMSQSEMVRPSDLHLDESDFKFMNDESVKDIIDIGLSDKIKTVIVDSLDKDIHPSLGLNDETLDMIQDQFKKFTEEEILPHANEWHLKDALIPDDVLKKMAELGVFSIAIPESYGGLGMGKVAMCVVTEELSRGFLAAGSLGTRAEIAGELIRLGGTEEQKKKYLPEIASGNILTTAVFTEPNTG
jgi:(2S)-methylsuccinyl-CoA dehydrogenase